MAAGRGTGSDGRAGPRQPACRGGRQGRRGVRPRTPSVRMRGPNDGSRLDLRDRDLAHPGCEGGTVHRPPMQSPSMRHWSERRWRRGDQGIRCEAGDQDPCPPPAEGRIHGQACAARGPAPQAGKPGLHRGFAARTCGSSMKTTPAGRSAMAGKRCANPSIRRCLALAPRRRAATGDFFYR